MQMEMQQKMADSAVETAKADIGMVQAKAEADHAKAMLQEQKQAYDLEIKQMQQVIDQMKAKHEMDFKYDELAANILVQMKKLDSQQVMEINKSSQALNQNNTTQ